MEEKTLFAFLAADRLDGLVAAAKQGDAEAFGQLVKDSERTLYRVSRTVLRNDQDCADAVQVALTKAWLRLETLREPRYFRTWLIRILLRECYRLARRNKRTKSETDLYSPGFLEAPGDDAIDLKAAMASLPEAYRVAIVLHHVEDMAVEEIARVLRVPQGTVKSRLARARAKLAACLRQKEESK